MYFIHTFISNGGLVTKPFSYILSLIATILELCEPFKGRLNNFSMTK